jgi:hypothetical protein
MSFEFGAINYWAVLVAAVTSFVIGGVWYTVLFGHAWARLQNLSEEQLAQMAKDQPRSFGIFIAGDLVMAMFLALLINSLEISTALGAAVLGATIWFGFCATLGAAKHAAHARPLKIYLINTGHELVCLIVMGLILGAWR